MDFIAALATAAAAISVPEVAFDKIVLTPRGSYIIGSFSSQEACAADVAKDSSLETTMAAAIMVSGQDQREPFLVVCTPQTITFQTSNVR